MDTDIYTVLWLLRRVLGGETSRLKLLDGSLEPVRLEKLKDRGTGIDILSRLNYYFYIGLTSRCPWPQVMTTPTFRRIVTSTLGHSYWYVKVVPLKGCKRMFSTRDLFQDVVFLPVLRPIASWQTSLWFEDGRGSQLSSSYLVYTTLVRGAVTVTRGRHMKLYVLEGLFYTLLSLVSSYVILKWVPFKNLSF